MTKGPSERAIIFLIGAIQFVNVLDFMMVMPMGPDFARALDIPSSRIGLIGGSYTAAASISGVIGATFLDRFDRRKALAVALLGLVIATALGGFAVSFATLLGARVLAGVFGGPATSLSLAVVADTVPPARRGRAMGAVMSAFSVASVLGVPAGLELARWGGWRLPFFSVAGLGAVIAASAIFLLPPLRVHLDAPRQEGGSILTLLRNSAAVYSLITTATVMLAVFSMVPNLSAFVQFNLHYPRERLSILYLVGGLVSFAATWVIGPLVDRFGPTVIATAGTVLFVTTLGVGFTSDHVHVPVLALYVAFMLSGAFRGVPMQALTSRVPGPDERARFMSAGSAVQHMASAIGAIVSAQLLTERADKSLEGMPTVAAFAIVLSLTLPVLMWMVETRVKQKEAPALADAQGRSNSTST